MTMTDHTEDGEQLGGFEPPAPGDKPLTLASEAPAAPKLPTTDEVLESLTGYDELAIEKAFGTDVESLMRSGKGLTYLRSLVFAQELHGGAKHDEAKKRALSLSVKELNARFSEPDDDDDLPGSDTGKDGI